MLSGALRELLSAWVREGLAREGWNQSELARRSGVTRDAIWRVLTRRPVSERNLAKLEAVLGPVPDLPVASRQAPGRATRPAGARTALPPGSGALDAAGRRVRRQLDDYLSRGEMPDQQQIVAWFEMLERAASPPDAGGEGEPGPPGERAVP